MFWRWQIYRLNSFTVKCHISEQISCLYVSKAANEMFCVDANSRTWAIEDNLEAAFESASHLFFL